VARISKMARLMGLCGSCQPRDLKTIKEISYQAFLAPTLDAEKKFAPHAARGFVFHHNFALAWILSLRHLI
jgi:hypothetical protein